MRNFIISLVSIFLTQHAITQEISKLTVPLVQPLAFWILNLLP